MRPPNLLVFLPDQQRTDTMACYGGTKVHAPALNKLASESVIFERAYVTQPICTPSRASLLSGLWPHTTGCTRNSVPLEQRFPTFAELLENKDYHCAYMGKWHLGADAPPTDEFPWWYRLPGERQHAPAIFDRVRLPQLYYAGITPEEYRGIKQRYLGLVTLVDRSIAAILGCLERFGLMDEMIIVHTSDHGDCLGAHQLFGKEVMFEEAARVPYLIRMPGQRRSMRINQPISHIDFLPTLLELLGQTKPPHCPGQSRVALLKGGSMPPQSIFMEWSPNRAKTVKRSSLATGGKLKERWRNRRAL